MKCIYLTRRSEKYLEYWFCRLNKKKIRFDDCSKCKDLKYKKIKKITNKTSKQTKLEKSRYSILTNDLEHCYMCAKKGLRITKDDLHEIYGGSNRKRSIQNGFVIPLCRNCHQNNETLKFLQKYMQKEYEKKYSREKFIHIIGKSYL